MPAAGGMIGAQATLRAPADGHTLRVTTAGMMAITPNANPRSQYKGGDFTQICQDVEISLALASNWLRKKPINDLENGFCARVFAG